MKRAESTSTAADGEVPLWRPDAARIATSRLTAYVRFLAARGEGPALRGDPAADYAQLHAWSVAERAAFWSSFADFCGLIAERGPTVLEQPQAFPGARWFPDTRLNYAENLLAGAPEDIVVIACDESGGRRELTRAMLRRKTAAVARLLADRGIGAGDVVAGLLPNGPEALIAMLAATSLGAAWTSTSPDFGADGVVDRFGQARARVLFASCGYRYGGRRYDIRENLAGVLARVDCLRTLVLVRGEPDGADEVFDSPSPVETLRWSALAADDAHGPAEPAYRRVPFDAPLFILYSSGTTGKPKAIVHGVGGSLLQHRKEHLLHVDLAPGDRLFYFTTCGWMMWNWLVSGLASGATLVLYDGSPMHPDPGVLWRMAEEEDIAFFGTSPRYLSALEKAGYAPLTRHALPRLRGVLSTGSPLAPAQFEYVYRDIAPDVHLASISGGTDILSCFCLGVPWLPVHAGEIQAAGLGMATEVFDVQGQPVRGQQGELVCCAPFPSVPLELLDDSDGRRYRRAYFERYPGCWHHGDYALRTPLGGFVILGRSDAVLNPGGVRIGTAEIYRQVEKLPEILESLAIGQRRPDGDERVVLFVRLVEGAVLDAALEQRIRDAIRRNTTPRHVPARILAVPDLPRTLSGKLVELAVRNVVHGLPVENRDALANPQSLDFFRDLPALRD